MEALKYNSRELPEEYLLAKLAFTSSPREKYIGKREEHKIIDSDRRNTAFYFATADIYNSTLDSFNQMLESEQGSEESLTSGLEQILYGFKDKTDFL